MRAIALFPPTHRLLASIALGAVLASPLAADPPAPTSGTGTIEFRVLTTSDEVRFFIDGNRVPARKRTAAWHAVRATIAVPAGEHVVEAKFRVAGTSEDAAWASITTRSPITVDAGAHVRLDADVRGARTLNAASNAHTFDVQVSGRGGVALAASHPSTGDVPVESKAPPAPSGGAATSSATPALIGGTIASAAIDPHAPAPTITIRGDEVVSDGKTVQPSTTAEDGTGPMLIGPGLVDDTPAVSDLASEDTAPAAAAAAGVAAGALVTSDAPSVPEPAPAAPTRLEVSFLVQSEPADANITLDGKSVGKTPLRVAIDPRQDHLLVIERQGCESVVQLLATEAWRSGRSAQTTVHLECK